MQKRRGHGRARRIAVGVAATAVAAAALSVAALPAGAAPALAVKPSASPVAEQSRVPDAVQVPAGNRRIAKMAGRGVQTYQCTNGAFTFLQPDAILFDGGRAKVLHSAGPVWTSVIDGSSVTGAVVASSPVPGAVPELLLSGVAHRGPGLLSAVTFIQRLDTTGGLAPTGSCTAGTTASVPYTAVYVFWARA